MIFDSEFIQHFENCNRYAFAHKELFYKLKNHIVGKYGKRDGYGLQRFWKYRHYVAQFYHYDLQWDYYESPPPDEYREYLYKKWASEEGAHSGDYDDYYDADCVEYGPSGDMRLVWTEDAMVRCVSQHTHILERWALQTERGKRVYHCPVDEYHYLAYKTDRHPVIVKHSLGFPALASMCKGKMGNVGDEKTPESVKPFQDLKWLIRWLNGR